MSGGALGPSSQSGSGVAVRLAAFDSAEVLARAMRVENTVEIDPDTPTLEEVREMIDEAPAVAGAADEGN